MQLLHWISCFFICITTNWYMIKCLKKKTAQQIQNYFFKKRHRNEKWNSCHSFVLFQCEKKLHHIALLNSNKKNENKNNTLWLFSLCNWLLLSAFKFIYAILCVLHFFPLFHSQSGFYLIATKNTLTLNESELIRKKK